jgi:hypothetical protein
VTDNVPNVRSLLNSVSTTYFLYRTTTSHALDCSSLVQGCMHSFTVNLQDHRFPLDEKSAETLHEIRYRYISHPRSSVQVPAFSLRQDRQDGLILTYARYPLSV